MNVSRAGQSEDLRIPGLCRPLTFRTLIPARSLAPLSPETIFKKPLCGGGGRGSGHLKLGFCSWQPLPSCAPKGNVPEHAAP